MRETSTYTLQGEEGVELVIGYSFHFQEVLSQHYWHKDKYFSILIKPRIIIQNATPPSSPPYVLSILAKW